MTYAVFLPSGYSPGKEWPVAFLMDPRGRAHIPLERMRAAANDHGYVLLSSYNTLSDSTTDVNERAMNAMLIDAQNFLRVDKQRIYLVGFSGTARISWDFAAALGNAVGGIFGAGASGMNFARDVANTRTRVPSPAYFGVVGDTDFNYEEMQSFELWLTQQSIPHRIRSFDGGHEWPPEALFREAVAWFELRAGSDSAFRASQFAKDTAVANQLERNARHAEVWYRWREIAADYRADHATYAQRQVERLSLDGKTRRALQQRRDLNRRFFEFHGALSAWVQQMRASDKPPTVASARKALRIGRLLRDAKDDSPDVAKSAQRQLEHAFVLLSFYEPRQLLQQRRPAHALTLLDLADVLKPNVPRTDLHRAYALIQLGRTDDALSALERAVAVGLPRQSLTRDASLQPLAGHARFQKLVALP
jgi:predicted esterase